MAEQTVILGTEAQQKGLGGTIRVATPLGDVLLLQEKDILQSDIAEVGGDMKRFMLAANAQVFHEMSGESLLGIDSAASTIVKYLDDGGTISKSRDDTIAS